MTLAELRKLAARKEIDTVLVVFPDVFGRLLGKRVTARFFLDAVVAHGTHGCNYLLTVDIEMEPVPGYKLANWESGYGDFALRPDLRTLRPLPWQTATALVICDLLQHDGKPVQEAPRSLLRRQLDLLKETGWQAMTASELEFFLYQQTFHEAFVSRYQGLTPSSDYRIDYQTAQPTRDEATMRPLRNLMDAAEVPIESSKGEWGKGQHEVNFIYDEPLAMADRHAVFKHGAREIAAQNGKSITFMAKPDAAEVGSSCHIHMSLWEGKRNLFWDARKRGGSAIFRQFLGGLLKYSPELCYFFAPTINSYKRYQPGSWAPTKMAWAYDNRTVGFRVVGEGNSFRIENRMPGADAHPHLAFAAMIAAGMAGIREKLDGGPIYTGNAYADNSLAALPHSLRHAADLLDSSAMARRAFGDAAVEFYAHGARAEVRAFENAVTDWERLRYFERI
jgi:glutamine synthetase